MINKEKADSKARIERNQEEFDKRIIKLSQDLQEIQQRYKLDGEKALLKIYSYQQRVKVAQGKESEMIFENNRLQDRYKKLDREKARLRDENDRYSRQLGGRFGSNSNLRIQYGELQREYNLILTENRVLRERGTTEITVMRTEGESASQNISAVEASLSYGGSDMCKSSLTQHRAEYEERIDEITDEKRELIMKNSAICVTFRRQKCEHKS